MYLCMYICIYVYMYVCIYIYIIVILTVTYFVYKMKLFTNCQTTCKSAYLVMLNHFLSSNRTVACLSSQAEKNLTAFQRLILSSCLRWTGRG